MRKLRPKDFQSAAEYEAHLKAQHQATRKRQLVRKKLRDAWAARNTAAEAFEAAEKQGVQLMVNVYQLGVSLPTIASDIGISKSRVHQLVQAAVQAAQPEEQTA